MPSVRLSKKDKESLLSKLRDGFDVESAGSILGLSQGQIELAQDKYGNELGAAYKIGTGKLKAKILQHALDEVNPAILLKLLELREKQAESADPITRIERVIFAGHCPHCGAQPGIGNPILNAEDKEPPAETDDNLPTVDVRAGSNF